MKLEAGKRGEKMKADENPCRKFTDACFRAFYIFTANGSVIFSTVPRRWWRLRNDVWHRQNRRSWPWFEFDHVDSWKNVGNIFCILCFLLIVVMICN